jgi:hypothetical protein
MTLTRRLCMSRMKFFFTSHVLEQSRGMDQLIVGMVAIFDISGVLLFTFTVAAFNDRDNHSAGRR